MEKRKDWKYLDILIWSPNSTKSISNNVSILHGGHLTMARVSLLRLFTINGSLNFVKFTSLVYSRGS